MILTLLAVNSMLVLITAGIVNVVRELKRKKEIAFLRYVEDELQGTM